MGPGVVEAGHDESADPWEGERAGRRQRARVAHEPVRASAISEDARQAEEPVHSCPMGLPGQYAPRETPRGLWSTTQARWRAGPRAIR